jgi:hypothetical protein
MILSPIQQSLVPTVKAVEIAHGDDSAMKILPTGLETLPDLHVFKMTDFSDGTN